MGRYICPHVGITEKFAPKEMICINLTLKRMKRYKMIYIMLIPIAAYFIVFSYYPLFLGILLSFQKTKLLPPSEFIGLANYKDAFSNVVYTEAFRNTVVMGIATFIAQFGFGLLLALTINEVRSKFVKSSVQSVTYLPYLLSWSIVGGMWIKILGSKGMFNGFLQLILGSDYRPVIFMAEQKYAQLIMVLTASWKDAGYTAVLLLAAIVSIDAAIYEAASIDGAPRLKQITHITLPNLIPTMKILVVLGSMRVLRAFDQIFVMQNSSIIKQIRTLVYLIFTDGIANFKVGLATAAATVVLITTFLITTIVRKLIKYDDSYS